jgi:hypothetical protein
MFRVLTIASVWTISACVGAAEDDVSAASEDAVSLAHDQGQGNERVEATGSKLAPPFSAPKNFVANPQSIEPAAAITPQAAGACTRRSDGKFNCFNRVPSRLFLGSTTTVVDNLRTNPSWFVCRAEGEFSGGGPHPTRWVWTQGDDFGNWGWARDIDIASETNPITPCS